MVKIANFRIEFLAVKAVFWIYLAAKSVSITQVAPVVSLLRAKEYSSEILAEAARVVLKAISLTQGRPLAGEGDLEISEHFQRC